MSAGRRGVRVDRKPKGGKVMVNGVNHRCTRCKRESYPRHKYMNSVLCDDCLSWVSGGRGSRGRSWFGSLWERIVDIAQRIFHRESPRQQERLRERASYARLKVMQSRARSIPMNPATMLPQKR